MFRLSDDYGQPLARQPGLDIDCLIAEYKDINFTPGSFLSALEENVQNYAADSDGIECYGISVSQQY